MEIFAHFVEHENHMRKLRFAPPSNNFDNLKKHNVHKTIRKKESTKSLETVN